MCTIDIGHRGTSWNLVLVLTTARKLAAWPLFRGEPQQEVPNKTGGPMGDQPFLPIKRGLLSWLLLEW